jgi:uncharacterized membrane protein
MVLASLRLAAQLLYALVFAVFWGTWFSQSRTMDALSAATFLENGRQYIANLAMPMRFLMPAALLATLASVYALGKTDRRAMYLTSAAALLMLIALAVTLAVNVPIDNQIKTWSLETLPSDWERIRDRWEAFHCLRAWLSFAGLACLAWSALPSRSGASY